jgi:hypothetical protein
MDAQLLTKGSVRRGDDMNAKDLAPGWQIRYRRCGFTEPWGKHGIRLHSAGTVYTIGWCKVCRWLRIHVIERAPPGKDEGQA